MNISKFFGVLFFVTLPMIIFADCRQKCEETYEECKAEHDSPNSEKVCGSDYRECINLCATDGE